MKYDSDTLAEINNSVNLPDYVLSQGIEVEERGDNYFVHCPLHIDKTASLCISKKNHGFICFSCGKKGKIVSWLMYFEGLSFDNAVEKAAKIADINLNNMCKSSTVMFLRKYKSMLHEKEQSTHEEIPLSALEKYSKTKIDSWIDEGIDQDVMDVFGIRMDVWGNRIVYPVYDLGGKLINIKGRTLYPNYKKLGLQKYINYYKVGTMDYLQGLYHTIDYVKEKNELIIFESIKSVMKAFGWGYKNCASAEKHTLTEEQIELIISLKVDVVFGYDSDVSYYDSDVKYGIDKLKKVTNVYIIQDYHNLLGGKEAKNAPVDCGREIWEALYEEKRKVNNEQL